MPYFRKKLLNLHMQNTEVLFMPKFTAEVRYVDAFVRQKLSPFTKKLLV